MRSAKIAVVLLAACMLPHAGLAAVTPATYTFYGRVDTGSGGLSGPNPGDIVYLTVTVDTSFPAFSQQNHSTLYYGGSGYGQPSPILAATVNGRDTHGTYDNVVITNDAAGQSGIAVQTLSPMGLSFGFTLSTTIKGVVTTDKIPKRVFPGNFQIRTFAVGVPPGLNYRGTIVD